MTGRLNLILLASDSALDGPAGALAALAQGLRARGHGVTAVLLKGDPAELPGSLKDAHLLCPQPSLGVGGLFRAWGAFRGLLGEIKPEAVISFDPQAHAIGQGAAFFAGIPHRVACHGTAASKTGFFLGLADALFGSLGIYTQVVASSYAVHGSFQMRPRSYRKRMDVVYTYQTPEGSPPARRDARKALGLPANGRVILVSDPLTDKLRAESLLDLLDALPKTLLLVSGDGPARDHMEGQIRDRRLTSRVRLLGVLDPDDLKTTLAASDLYVHPGAQDGMDGIQRLLAAMSTGVPVLAGDTPFNRELLVAENGSESGVLIASADPAQWAQSADRVLRDTARRKAMAAAARKRVTAFSPTRMTKGFERVMAPRS